MTESDTRQIQDFLNWLLEAYRGDARFPKVSLGHPLEGQGAPGAVARLEVAAQLWYDVTVSPDEKSIQVGIATLNRTQNEEFEQAIEDSRDTMDEFLEVGMHEAGEEEPHPMLHFHDYAFRFASKVPFGSADDLESPDLREKIKRMLEGYYMAWSEYHEAGD